MNSWEYEEKILEPFQYPFEKTGVSLYRGARSTGKTYNMVRNMVIKAHKEGVSVLSVRNTLESLEDSCYAEIKEALDELEIGYKATVNPLRIVCTTGIKFHFKGLDKPGNLKSFKSSPRLGIVWFEEASDGMKEEDIRKVMLSVRTGRRWYVLTYNPEGENHWLEGWEKSRGVNVTTCFDNPYNDEIFYEELEMIRKTDPKEYRKVAYGEWITKGDTLYNVTEENLLEEPEIYYNFISIGIDLGENDATSFVATGFRGDNKEVDVIEQYRYSNADNTIKKTLVDSVEDFDTFYKMVQEKYNFKYMFIFSESASGSLTFRTLLKQKGYDIKIVQKKLISIEDRVQMSKYLIASNSLRIRKGLPLINAMKQAARNPDGNKEDRVRKHTKDMDSLDSFEYSVMHFVKNLSIPPMYFKNKKLDLDKNEAYAKEGEVYVA